MARNSLTLYSSACTNITGATDILVTVRGEEERKKKEEEEEEEKKKRRKMDSHDNSELKEVEVMTAAATASMQGKHKVKLGKRSTNFTGAANQNPATAASKEAQQKSMQ